MKPTPYGMTAEMYQAFLSACRAAGIKPPRIVQTIGNAPASAGFHAKDGFIAKRPYCAAVDLSVKSFFGLIGYKDKTIKWFLWHLALHGFVAWYRYRGPFTFNRHIHMVYVGVPMKPQLRRQVHDFLNGRTGLAGHALEPYWTAPQAADETLKRLYLKANPPEGL